MIKRETFCFLLFVLSVSLVTSQCHGAEIALSPTDRNISWPLVAEFAFAQDIIHTIGQLTFRTNNRQVELNFGQGSQQITLSFTSSKFLDTAVFDSQALLHFDGEQFDSLVMIAQLFSDKDQLWDLPLWGQFKVLRPNEYSPLGSQFSYMPPNEP